ncbi:uncharacterized protein [Haliotis asinina]|uniref:uncharacterized protein n=1 Tax=Haliotis asinina TaxID=109174 RepID=UPI003531A4F6
MPRLTSAQRNQAIGRLEAGHTAKAVANHFHVNVRTIYRLQERFRTTNTTDDRPRTGRPRVTTRRQDRHIVRRHVQTPFQQASETARQTIGTYGRPLSTSTVRRRLSSSDLQCRRPYRGPRGGGGGGIGLNQRVGPVVFQNLGPERGGGITAARYIDQALRPHVIPHFARHRNNVFQHDNARAHTARAIRDFLQQNGVNVMQWPALSPDLNPIEHLWDEIQRRLNDVIPRPNTADLLRQAFLRVWNQVPMAFINRLVHSMPRRCAAVIASHGGHTRY